MWRLGRAFSTEPRRPRSLMSKIIIGTVAAGCTVAGVLLVKNAFYAYELPRKKESSHKDGEEAPSADSDQRTSSSKPRVVVLGSGWGAVSLCRNIDTEKFDVTCVSPRNYFLMTPLLASVAVGTIENRAVCESIRQMFGRSITYVESECYDVDPEKKVIQCTSSDQQNITISASHVKVTGSSSRVVGDSSRSRPESFSVPYDILVVSVGAEVNSFNVPGVQEHAHFLKELKDARRIRCAISDCFESAATPEQSPEERARLLNFVIVGGGPTGVELGGELVDLIEDDLKLSFPNEAKDAKVILVEALDHILSTYDQRISEYTESHFLNKNITLLMNSAVKEVKSDGVVVVRKGGEPETIPCGMTVWATGIKPRPVIGRFRKAIGVDKQTNSRALLTNEHLQVVGSPSMFAIGDCATIQHPRLLTKLAELFRDADSNGDGKLSYAEFSSFVKTNATKYPQLSLLTAELLDNFKVDQTLGLEEFKVMMARADSKLRALPATAQVAAQQGEYLAHLLNAKPITAFTEDLAVNVAKPFSYQHLGSMAYIGGDEAILDFSSGGKLLSALNLAPSAGWGTYWLWRSVYFSELFTTRNRAQLAFDWTRSKLFGRDISRD